MSAHYKLNTREYLESDWPYIRVHSYNKLHKEDTANRVVIIVHVLYPNLEVAMCAVSHMMY